MLMIFEVTWDFGSVGGELVGEGDLRENSAYTDI